jgi:hypothetical protein
MPISVLCVSTHGQCFGAIPYLHSRMQGICIPDTHSWSMPPCLLKAAQTIVNCGSDVTIVAAGLFIIDLFWSLRLYNGGAIIVKRHKLYF